MSGKHSYRLTSHDLVERIAKRLWPEAWRVTPELPKGDDAARQKALAFASRVIDVVLEESRKP